MISDSSAGLNVGDFGVAQTTLLAEGGRTLHDDDSTNFPNLSAPARRALSSAGYTRLEQLADVNEAEVSKLHGMGPSAIDALRGALREHGLSFRA